VKKTHPDSDLSIELVEFFDQFQAFCSIASTLEEAEREHRAQQLLVESRRITSRLSGEEE